MVAENATLPPDGFEADDAILPSVVIPPVVVRVPLIVALPAVNPFVIEAVPMDNAAVESMLNSFLKFDKLNTLLRGDRMASHFG